MQSNPLVSVLIVTHNADRFIRETVRSCLKQSYTNLEILVYDNASTDGTRRYVEAEKDPRLHVQGSTVNLGPYEALNVLLGRAAGDFIAIQDHDDLWFPTKIADQLVWLTKHPEAVGCGTHTYYYYEDQQVAALSAPAEKTRFVDHTSLIFRKCSVRYQPHHAIPDEAFEATLQTLGELGCVQKPLVVHRLRADRSNLSVRRTKGNFMAAYAHWKLTNKRDFLGSMLFIVGGLLPAPVIWWLRRHVTLRKVRWISKKILEGELSGYTL